MAKSITSIVSFIGLVQSIIINLVKRVESLGGSEEDIRRLANPEDPVVQRVAEAILLVKHESQLPKRCFPNWLKICEVMRVGNPTLKRIVELCVSNDPLGEVGRRLVSAFPEYWSDKLIKGPIPLSLLRRAGRQESTSFDGSSVYQPADVLEALSVLDIDPIIFITSQAAHDLLDDSLIKHFDFRDSGTDTNVPVGGIVCINDREYVLLEKRHCLDEPKTCFDDCKIFAPAEGIAMDL
jgi:hypothetical protein